MEFFTLMHAKALYLRFCAIYDHKFIKSYHDEDFKSLWASEWSSGLSAINPSVIKDALEHCKRNLEWPPSIAEFIKICESFLGVPTVQECMKLAVRREFNHPLVLLCYEKVGSWAIKNDTEKQLAVKFESAYQQALSGFRSNPNETWAQLKSYNAKPQELPAPEKIPSTGESKAFRECMNKCQEILLNKKIQAGGKTYKEFDANKIKKGHREFNQQVFDDYKAYLLSIPETETMILPPGYLYDRNKFLNAIEQPSWLKEQGYKPNPHIDAEDVPKRKYGPSRPFNSWVKD